MTVILRDERAPTDSRHLEAKRLPDGALRIDGQDLGDSVERHFGSGHREYEWITEVAAADVPRLVAALGGEPSADVEDVIRATCTDDPARLERTIRAAGITPKFWSRIGD